MKVRITSGNRGPIGTVREVYAKLESWQTWYIIDSTKGYHVDDSYVEPDDKVTYEHPEVKFRHWENVSEEFTFIADRDCEEIEVSNNKEARSLLSKEW